MECHEFRSSHSLYVKCNISCAGLLKELPKCLRSAAVGARTPYACHAATTLRKLRLPSSIEKSGSGRQVNQFVGDPLLQIVS